MALATALLVLPGLLTLTPLPASAAPAQPQPPRAVVPVPPKLDRKAPSIPSGEGALSIPRDWDKLTPERSRRKLTPTPVPGAELTSRRDRTTKVFARPDGSEIVRLHTEPVHFQAQGSTVWQDIDNRLIADPDHPGFMRNAANEWIVRFGPITAGGGGGMSLQTAAGTRSHRG